VQPYLSQVYAGGQNLQATGAGLPYLGPMQVPLDPNAAAGVAGTGVLGIQQSQDPTGIIANINLAQAQAANVIGTQGLTAPVQGAMAGLGQAAAQYGNIYSQAQGATNPYLQATIDAQNLRGNEAIQSSMSAAGRYGSGQYQDVMARAQAQVADPLLMQDYEARQARALQATQGLGQTYGQQAGIAQQGLGQALQYAQGLGPLAQAQYLPYEMQTAAGQYMTNYAQQGLQGAIQQYNAQAMFPWENLQRENALLSGAGTLGGSTVTAQTPLQASLAQRLAGGALVGAGLGSAVPGLGTGLGAGVGALAGAFL
jgi:hypothetical protein